MPPLAVFIKKLSIIKKNVVFFNNTVKSYYKTWKNLLQH